MSKQLTFSILIPVYRGSSYLEEALSSVIKQNFNFYELIVLDDNKLSDRVEIKKTKEIVSKFKNERIIYLKNKENLGSQANIKKLASLAKGDILFYLCQDDVLAKDALKKTYDAFFMGENIAAVTRPYFWFEDDISKPVRAIYPPDDKKNTILSIFDGEGAIKAIFDSLGQLSGLAYRKSLLNVPFNLDVFPGHIYPFAGVLKKYKCVFLNDFTVAVRIQSSQSRNISSIYNTSPLASWVKMFDIVYKGEKYDEVRRLGIKHIATHYEGLIQIKNFGPQGAVWRELTNILKSHWQSIFDLKFLFYAFLALFIPRKILIIISDNYKRLFLSRFINKIDFQYFT